ncbi:hypothetical protein ACFVDI_27715 [Nocardioides sp. NPDC057767]|uniref:Uncharacterized protein n=1 Tax=Nocardioides panzhihuensis TaxID=860243 RepID=A0A7Z0DN31_9ACTN|nr:hypothetical protein [Nocardioides panzhihuensis]NYI78294.1 hypothetical protein [Nocardioides panzhihuensis]
MLKTGARLRSQVCDTQMIVVRADATDGTLTCGGSPVIELTSTPDPGLTLAADAADGTAIGKRYVDGAGTIEVLVTKPGTGSLALDGEALTIKSAKPLPSSD